MDTQDTQDTPDTPDTQDTQDTPDFARRALLVRGSAAAVAAVALRGFAMAETTQAAGAAWVVAPDGAAGKGVAGTPQAPWSFAYAAGGADGRVRPGDTVSLQPGVYRSPVGTKISISGEPGRPVTWRAPAERCELDGALPEFVDRPATAWEAVEVRPGHNLYRSTGVYPKAAMYGGFVQLGGQWLPLATHKGLDWIRSDDHTWRDPGPFYLGPGVYYHPDDGRLYVRLDNSTPQAQCGRAVAQIADPDPRRHALRISPGDQFGLTVAGSHHVFEGFTAINDYYGGFVLSGDAGATVGDVTFRGVGGRVTYFGARLGRSDGVVIQNPAFDGCMDPERWWVSWVDVKGAGTPADHVRKCGLDYGNAQHVEVSGGYFHDFFDAALSEAAHDVEVHGVEFRTWDDAWQMYGSVYRIDQHHNLYLGAGPSRDGSATDRDNPQPGTLWIHDNVIDTTRYRVFFFRYGRVEDDPKGIGWREPIPFSTHGVPTAGRRTIPWKLYQNTVVTGRADLPVFSYVGAGQFGDATATVQAPHEAYNNVFLVTNGRPLAQDAWAGSGAEVYDGNVYWGWSTPSIADPTTIWRFLHRKADVVDGQTPSGRMGDAAKVRGLALPDSAAYYPPGWEAAGLSVDPQLDPSYKPHNPALTSGAVSLTAKGWPGTSAYKPWRGAVQP